MLFHTFLNQTRKYILQYLLLNKAIQKLYIHLVKKKGQYALSIVEESNGLLMLQLLHFIFNGLDLLWLSDLKIIEKKQ